MNANITERRRSTTASRLWGVSSFALAVAAGWVVAFSIDPMASSMPYGFWERSYLAVLNFPESMRHAFSVLHNFTGSNETILHFLQNQGPLTSYTGRAGIAFIAALAAAGPIARWRYEQTPRRLGTDWLGVDWPRWSEQKDAVDNANLALAPGIARTGTGLTIAPGVALSKEQEALSILILGDRGSGKTVAIWQLIHELRRRPRVRIILHDTKGDITARWPDDKVILLAPHDRRSWAWAVGRDIIGEVMAREFAALLISASDREPNWPNGAQEIFVGIIKTLQTERRTEWDWADLRAALELPDNELREFACRYHKAAQMFLSLTEENFTRTAQGYVSTLMAPINKLVSPLAAAWGDVHPDYRISLKAWLDEQNPVRPTMILQRAPDLSAMSAGWIGSAVQCMIRHLVASREDNNPSDNEMPDLPEVWFLLDELAQLGVMPEFFQLLETGRSLNIRAAIGLQNFSQLIRLYGPNAADEMLSLSGSLIALRQNPGKSSKIICEERLTKAPVRTRKDKTVSGKTIREPDSKEIEILRQDDLASLKITRDGAQGFLIIGNAAYGMTWRFPIIPVQRRGTIRAKWIVA